MSSYNVNASNNSSAIQHAINSLGTIASSHPISTISTLPINGNGNFGKNSPTFKMEMYKSENGGFILNLIKTNPSSYSEEGKLFILSDIENLGRDIQNILMVEIIKK
jgi:hypothetical protein